MSEFLQDLPEWWYKPRYKALTYYYLHHELARRNTYLDKVNKNKFPHLSNFLFPQNLADTPAGRLLLVNMAEHYICGGAGYIENIAKNILNRCAYLHGGSEIEQLKVSLFMKG